MTCDGAWSATRIFCSVDGFAAECSGCTEGQLRGMLRLPHIMAACLAFDLTSDGRRFGS